MMKIQFNLVPQLLSAQGAGWPSKTGGKSGGGRDNAPSKK